MVQLDADGLLKNKGYYSMYYIYDSLKNSPFKSSNGKDMKNGRLRQLSLVVLLPICQRTFSN